MDAIEYAYKEKKIDGNIYHPIVKSTGAEMVKGVDAGYGILQDADFDSPDYIMREYLKKNVWKFAVAKNYNDCIRLSNLLIREDGSLRPWNEFKREAQRVVGDSNRYLKTEYDTIVASAQMSRLWNEIQRDKHIFPLVQFLVVMDGHTSEVCSPLHNVIVKVDDPKLEYYFPPNHFNCRTSLKKLRSGRVTEEISWPEIPEAFQNNAGVTGLIFTDKNVYIENTPEKVLDQHEKYAERWQKYSELLNDDNYTDVQFNDVAGVKAIHKKHNFDSKYGYTEKTVQQMLFEKGHSVILESEIAAEGIKTPDGKLNDKTFDIKAVIGENNSIGKNNIKNKFTEANSQGCETVVLYFDNEQLFSEHLIIDGMGRFKKMAKKDNKDILIKEILVMLKGGEIKKFRL